jgi:peptidoglycan/xylan/chitin deacetylase (PgdA/CDA1 family)
MRVAISFDYDSPAGYRESFSHASLSSTADVEGTQALLEVLAEHDIRATFAIVGNVALDGPFPAHCPEQVRSIHAAEHEIAAHSMHHRFIPPMRREELLADVRACKEALEVCIEQDIRGFVPPFNRPSHFPQMGAFSVSEVVGLHGRGRGRQSIASLLETLRAAAYGWCRVSFKKTFESLTERLGINAAQTPPQPFLCHGIVAVPLHNTGFGPSAVSLMKRYMNTDLVVTLCGHPFQALDENRIENSEHVDRLAELLETFEAERADGTLKFCTMSEVEADLHATLAAERPVTQTAVL